MENRGVLRGPACTPGAIRAISLSTAVAPIFDAAGGAGIVSSVHRSAVNLVVGNRLVTVASALAGGLPNGLLVEDPFDPRALGVQAGMAVRFAAGCLTIGPIRVSTGGAVCWRPEIPGRTVPGDLDVRLSLARVAAGTTRADGLVATAAAVSRLATALAAGDEAAVVRAGRGLVGLGPGLTPSGDDVLVGLTAGLAAIGDPRRRRLAGAWARHARGRTTTVAAAFHDHAAAGAYSERLHDAARAILAGPLGGIRDAVRTAAAWGATSGGDTLAGMLLGLGQARVGRTAAGPTAGQAAGTSAEVAAATGRAA